VSPRIKDSSLQAVLAAANIVDVISGYTSLRKRGGTYSGLCPFHQEKTPSFTVNADKGLYYCFGCGEGGDLVRFVERIDNLSFSEAVEQLGERFRVAIEYEEGKGGDLEHKGQEARVLQLLEKAATYYQRLLWESDRGRPARDYLAGRGLGEEVCRVFRVGLAPAGWRELHGKAVKEGFTDEELEAAGILVRQRGNSYDRFRGRLMFPLVDHRGRVLGFGGRTLGDEAPKYLNSPEGLVYQKGHLLYGLYQARKDMAAKDEVLVVEGYTDVLALAQAGVTNVVASMGTALTPAQIGLMTRFTRNITFMFDADQAGMGAMLRSGGLARSQGLRPMMAELPLGADPADLAVTGGREAIAQVLNKKTSLLGFELRQALAAADTSTVEGRVRAFEEVRQIMARASSLKEREEEVQLLAGRLNLTAEDTKMLLEVPVEQQPAGVAAMPSARPSTAAMRAASIVAPRLLSHEAQMERRFLLAAACNPKVARVLLKSLTPDHFTDAGSREIFLELTEVLQSLSLDALDETTSVEAGFSTRTGTDSEASRFFIQVLVASDRETQGPLLLEELHLRIQAQHLRRAIGLLRQRLDADADVEDTQRRLLRMERLLQSVRTSLTNLDPNEGQA